ncbi:aminoglycoside phosphotransferase family protein [Actinopolymorpha alba]|uniref:aminoglycoside phosphotransferase family protein n=1 Tax=Actinopolymorpha alba TaxID=533267 RepID=UPI0012F6A5E1|nr:aminoglycoside phosphotransferase family protein [Actinopolymorpha alba]
MNEQPLAGGHLTDEVVRVGSTVRRTRGPHSTYVASLLGYLESVGYSFAPRYLGIDEAGRDIFTYIPGSISDHPRQRACGAAKLGARMLRDLHDITAGHPLADGEECITHGDAGSTNTLFQDGYPVAFIDWDFAGPGNRIDDVAYMAWSWCIYPVDQIPISQQADQVREVRYGYGHPWVEELVHAMVGQQTALIAEESVHLTDLALPAARRDQARHAIEWATACREIVNRHT